MIKMAFYKAQKKDFWGNLISGYTSLFNWKTPPYCHVEIGFFLQGRWVWYSSSSKKVNGQNGTRWIQDEELLKHPERWDVYDVKNVRSIDDMVKTCEDECGKPYDWQGIMGFATPFGQLNFKKKWYCSEVCHYVFFGKWRKRVSPKRFFKLIKKNIA